MKIFLTICMILILLPVTPAAASSTIQTISSAESSSGPSLAHNPWEVQFMPYVWTQNLNGTVETETIGIKNPGDLEPGYNLHVEANYEAGMGFLIDIGYLDVSATDYFRNDPYDVNLDSLTAEFLTTYSYGGEPEMEFLAGLRYVDANFKVDQQNGRNITDESKDWIDLIIGLRYIWHITPQTVMTVKGDIGGYGWWDSSDLSWNLAWLFSYYPWEHAGITGGYRVLDMRYSNKKIVDRFAYNITSYGPVLGINIRW